MTLRSGRILLIIIFILLGPVRMGWGQDSLLVSGTIYGGDAPVPGVSVSYEGSSGSPVITDEAGNFQIRVPSAREWLLITPAGLFHKKRIFLDKRTRIRIQLIPIGIESGFDDAISLLGPEPRRNFISSSEFPEFDRVHFLPYESIGQYFQGSVSGDYVINGSGMPASGTFSLLRGIKSMHTNSQPLIIVDGLPLEPPGTYTSLIDGNSYNPATNIEPLDISGITILKDYLGSSMFGMRGSNGVILIETLQPTEVRTTIDLAMRTGIYYQPRQIPQLNSDQFRTYANEVLLSSGGNEEDFMEKYEGLFLIPGEKGYYRYDHNTNWQNEIFTNSLQNDIYLRVKGGDEIARYGLSVGYLNHKGIIKETGYDRYNIRFVGTFNIFQWLRMYISSNLNTSQSDLKESALVPEASPILTGLAKSPLLAPYQQDENGHQLIVLDDVEALGISNPAAIIQNYEANDKIYRFLNSFRVEGDITDKLRWKSIIGLNLNIIGESIFMPDHGMEPYYGGDAYNVIKSLKNKFRSFYSDNNLNFSQTFNQSHLVKLGAGFRVHTNSYESDWGISENANENDEYKQLQSGTSYLWEIGGTTEKWNRAAIYVYGGYSFRDKYLLYGNMTAEASSMTGPEADLSRIGTIPYGTFYSAGLAWRISNESFLRDLSSIEELKLRFSYGRTGNDDVGFNDLYNHYILTYYRESSGMVPATNSNGDLKFETCTQYNAGLDLALWANRFSMALDLYDIRTRDMLVQEFLPAYTGFHSVSINSGKLSNKGLDLSVFLRLINLSKLNWDLNLNLSGFRNRVDDILNGEIVTQFTGGEYISRIGEPLLSFYGLRYKGVFSTSLEAEAAHLVNSNGVPFEAGDAWYEDLSGPEGSPDGVIDDYDKTIIGSAIPEYFGGISTSISYGRWSIQAGFQYVYGNEAFNYVRSLNEGMSGLSNQSVRVMNRWVREGQITDVPRASWNDPAGNAVFSTRWIEDASYLRLKDVTLAYTIKEKFLVFRNAEVYLTGINLLTYSKYLGYDPEFSYSYQTMLQGIDYGLMPQGKKLMLGIKLGF